MMMSYSIELKRLGTLVPTSFEFIKPETQCDGTSDTTVKLRWRSNSGQESEFTIAVWQEGGLQRPSGDEGICLSGGSIKKQIYKWVGGRELAEDELSVHLAREFAGAMPRGFSPRNPVHRKELMKQLQNVVANLKLQVEDEKWDRYTYRISSE